MRNELNTIEKIERYLQGSMSAEERNTFEKEIENNPQLKAEVNLQKQLMQGIRTIELKTSAKKAYSKYKFGKGLKKWGGIGGGIIVVTAATYLTWNYFSKDNSDRSIKLSYELPELNENGEKVWADADKYLPYQIFSIDNSKDTVVETQDGIVMAVPAGCFLNADGNPVNGNVELEVKEAINSDDILMGGLSTRSGNTPLETGGMFYLNARKDGENLKIDPSKGIVTQVPASEIKPGMQVYEGKRMPDGGIDWVAPKPLEKFLLPVNIHTLNFYPPEYEDSLAGMGKPGTKFYKDSLYYSFARLFEGSAPAPAKDTTSVAVDTTNNVVSENTGTIAGIIIKTGKNPLEINFSNIAKANKYEWDFGDGSKSNLPNPKHTYESIGNYVVSVVVYDQYGTSYKDQIFLDAGQNKGGKTGKVDSKILDKRIFYFPDAHYPQTNFHGIKFSMKGANLTGELNNITFNETNMTKLNKFASEHGFLLSYAVNPPGKDGLYTMNVTFFRDRVDLSLPDSTVSLQRGINPAKVKAIWDIKFNNTILATREFEERMPYIHRSCNNQVLDLYVNNLDKKLCTIDSMAAKLDPEFMEFAQRGDGRVQQEKQGHIEKLKKYYEKKAKAYAQAASETEKAYWKKQNRAKEKFNEKQGEQMVKDIKRETDNFKKEYDINLKEALRQLGMPEKIPVNPGPVGVYTVTVTNPGWKNIDRAVYESTMTRTDLGYFDPVTGKTARIKYEELTVTVNDRRNYDAVFVYMIPAELNSFMRLKENNGMFNEKMNEFMQHEMVCVAYKGEQAYFAYTEKLLPGKHEVSLTAVGKKELQHKLAQIKKYGNEQKLVDELAFRHIEQKENIRQKQVEDLLEFRSRIERVIFPCGEPGIYSVPAAPAADSVFVTAHH